MSILSVIASNCALSDRDMPCTCCAGNRLAGVWWTWWIRCGDSVGGALVDCPPVRRDRSPSCLGVRMQKRGTKALVLDPSISGPLTLLEPNLPELLTEHGVIK